MKKYGLAPTVALLAALTLNACGGGGSSDQGGNGPDMGQPLVVDANGASGFDRVLLGSTLTALPVEALSAAEMATLVFMREEEKLAHDVYAQLDARWGANVRVFGNIANSEATHTEAVRQLLVRYGLPDPASALATGVFQNTSLQLLYTQLVASGTLSLTEALRAGAAIEEIDMMDINTALLAVDNQDIRLVYESLLKGSRNHLRSFVATLLNHGVTYVPQYMNVVDYSAIVATAIER